MKRHMNKINAVSLALLVKLLVEGTRTCQQLAEDSGLSYVTILRYTRAMHAQKVIYIDAWDGFGREAKKVYKLGEGRDAKRQKLSTVQRSRMWRARKRQFAPVPLEEVWSIRH